jgi:LmbE family N-acetylglucosaminyl deacetylase
MAPNFRTGARRPAKATRAIPHLYYAQPFGGKDILGQEIRSRVFVDISGCLELKEKMLACHESQQAWLRAQQDVTKLNDPMQEMARRAGELSGWRAAEGFRQHLGQGFPQDNLLEQLLGDLVRTVDP